MNKTNRREFFNNTGVTAIACSCLAAGVGSIHAQEKSDVTSATREFMPGEKVPASGIYDVLHDKIDGDDHAQQHQLTLIAGTVFPRCKVCGGLVTFRLYKAAEHVEAAPHFAP